MGDAAPALTQPLECDIAIIGTGVTGALIADELVTTRKRIVMLDARDLALGSTAATTALLQYEIDTHLVDLARRIGAERAVRAYQACASSFELLERRFPELLKACGYRRRESLYLAADEAVLPALKTEMAARLEIGFACEWLEGDVVERRYGCRRPGAILSSLGADLDPMRFTQALMAGVERHGVRRFARARVTAIEERGGGLRLSVEGGLHVDANHVVVAAGFESLDFLPVEVADIDNTYAVATEPLTDRGRAATMPIMWESARPYLYIRGTPDGRLLVGGADVPFRNPAARDALLPRQVRSLARGYRNLFGEDLPPIAYAWGGSFASTRDGLPFIGRVPGMHPGLQFALCFGGNGITFSVHAAGMIRAAIENQPHDLDEVFGFGRMGTEMQGAGRKGFAAATHRIW